MRIENSKKRREAKTVEMPALDLAFAVAEMTLVERAEWQAAHPHASLLENDRTDTRVTIEIPCIG